MDSNLIRKLQGLGKDIICAYDSAMGAWQVWEDGADESVFGEHPDLEVAIQSFLDMAGGK